MNSTLFRMIAATVLFNVLPCTANATPWEQAPTFHRSSGTYVIEAQAVVNAPIESLVATSLDYDHYAQKGVPTVVTAKIVRGNRTRGPMQVAFHNLVQAPFVNIESYFSVLVKVQRKGKDVRISWGLANDKQYDNGTVESISGYWLLSSLSANQTRISYHLSTNPITNLPDSLISGFMKRSLTDQVTSLFSVLFP